MQAEKAVTGNEFLVLFDDLERSHDAFAHLKGYDLAAAKTFWMACDKIFERLGPKINALDESDEQKIKALRLCEWWRDQATCAFVLCVESGRDAV